MSSAQRIIPVEWTLMDKPDTQPANVKIGERSILKGPTSFRRFHSQHRRNQLSVTAIVPIHTNVFCLCLQRNNKQVAAAFRATQIKMQAT